MMNGEGPSVPITTLAGIQSLTDLLLELPLPTPLPGSTGSRSLLSHLRDSDEARQLLNSAHESFLVPPLIEALSRTTTDNVEVKDGYYGGASHGGQTSQLLQFLLSRSPNIFKGVISTAPNITAEHHPSTSQWIQRQCTASSLHPQQQPFASVTIPSCPPHPNSPQFATQGYQMDQSQGNRHIHNKQISVSQQPKTPLGNYPQYVPTVASNDKYLGQQHASIVHNAVSQGPTPSPHTPTSLQENQQFYESTIVNKYNTSPASASHTFSNGNCGENTAILSPAKLTDRTENHLPENQQTITNTDLVYSSFVGTRSTSKLTCSSTATTQQIHTSQGVISPTHQANNKSFEQHLPSTSSVTFETSSNSSLQSPSQKSLINNKERDSNDSTCNISDLLCDNRSKDNMLVNDENQLNQEELRKSATTGRRKSSEPVVILDKLSIEDQVLAQKSVKEFTKKVVGVEETRKSPKSKNCESSAKECSRRKSSSEDVESEKLEKGFLSPKKKSKENLSSSKDFVQHKDKTVKKQCDTTSFDVDYKQKPSESTSTSLGERVKKRRRSSQLANYAESPVAEVASDPSSDETPISNIKMKKTKIKKIKKEKIEQLSTEDLMDTNTYQHFSRTVEAIFDSMEELDFSADIDEDSECPAEALIPLFQLQELCNEAAKLKMLQAMNQFPPERLVRLLSILERNVLDGAKILPIQSTDERDEEEAKLWLELTMERVMRSADSSLTALYIMTSPNMPEKVFLEDVIERIVLFLKFQLQNTVYPVFDPAYRIDPKSKDGYVGNIKQKRAHAHKVKEKSIIQLYNKLHEAVGLLAELLEVQTLTDTIILQVSTLGVGPFFVEGVNELQLNVLRLVTTVFAKYDKHRQLILEDILASIARLPTSKRSLRNYRLNSEEHIQMLTALVLQLIHSVVRLPEPENNMKQNPYLINDDDDRGMDVKDMPTMDKDVMIITSYEAAVRTAINFLSVFLKKCGTKNEEMDYRPLFENFVQDLLSTVNKPEWPASELLLSLLGRLLVQNFSNKSLDMTLRVASLDYLGVVAARLRKDAVSSQLRKETINEVIKQILGETADSDILQCKSKKSKHKQKSLKKDDTQILQKVLLRYLDANVHSDPALQFARKFYIAQWYRDAAAEIRSDKMNKEKTDENEQQVQPNNSKPIKGVKLSRHKRRSSQVNCEVDVDEEENETEKDDAKLEIEGEESNIKLLALAEERKRFLLSVIKLEHLKQSYINQIKHIDYNTAELISSFLASKRPFSQSFDIYLSQILRVLNETAVAVRTKAMKCLTLVVEADPSILARPDMQRGVHGRLLDQSTSVREAAVDLVGKFILIRPELTSQYYEMLTDRILDTGVSVRKRVIKILKDVCLEQPDFPKIPEICVKIIRRVNDEDGIKKLVGEVFQSMWFTPASDREPKRILQKVKNITHVVAACKDTGLEWFEQLLTNLLKNKDDSSYKGVIKSCTQIVDCLVENVLQLEESTQEIEGSGASQNLVACLTTLYLFCKIHPYLVVPHVNTIQPYLSMTCNKQADYHVLLNVAKTLELIVPLIEHPSESFLAQIEEDMVKLILRHGMFILPSCVSCLGAVVNRVTHNYQLVCDCFQKFFVVLLGFKKEHENNPNNPLLIEQRPKLLRSLFTVGLFCRHFDFTSVEPVSEISGQEPLKNRVFEVILYFTKHECEDIRHKALTGLGFMMIRHYEFMLGKEVKELYYYLLCDSEVSAGLKCQVLKNLSVYLLEEEARMIQKDAEWSKVSKSEDLKEMGDVSSGMASTVIQVYLKQILESVLHTSVNVRRIALQVIHLILGQGLVHPVQIVPYLICMGSDDDQILRTKADQLLQEIEKKYPGFVQMKALSGVRMSYKMQQLIHSDSVELIRGFRSVDNTVSRNGFLYSVIRGTRQNRRAFVLSLLKLFDEQARTPLSELLYIGDNIVYFPFQVQDEPLFIIHQIDVMLSVSGSNLLQSFREALIPVNINSGNNPAEEDDDDDDFDSLYQRLPGNTSVLQECMSASQACLLLLFIKQTLKEMYGFTDNKIQQYSPNESVKVYEKAMNRKVGVKFKPISVINFVKGEDHTGMLDEAGKRKLIQQYLNFKQLMLTIDPADDDDDEQTNRRSSANASKLLVSVLHADDEEDNSVVNTVSFRTPDKGSSRNRSPGSSRHSRSKISRSSVTKEKKKKEKFRKKRKRIIDSDNSGDDTDSDPDYMEVT
ncbi:nipped-B-like protein [Centruroides sculpturatus]|uniref:nipped-B-like protein n=1 Tax=Centruroides sculpturatus TaxID=218467 RepID=UPI000C6E5806|nr:nipped-B-like protein [Centruroides sculpturatus]XP_023223914.1 nipped-B-like protein [Centruroides sculpturatus]